MIDFDVIDQRKAEIVGKIEQPVSVYDLECILEGAFEGGSNYWISKVSNATPEIDCTYYSELVAVHDGKVTIEVDDDWGACPQYTRTIGREDVLRGLNLWATKCEGFAFDNMDAEDYDCILQLAMWGELIFG